MSSMNLREIFDAITPHNIKSIPLIDTAIDIFIEQLEEVSPIAIDISRIWDNVSNKTTVGGSELEKEIVTEAKDKLRNLLLQTYVSILYKTLKDAQTNINLYEIFARDGITDSPLNGDVFDAIGDEYFLSNKAFNELVGTQRGLDYAYHLGQYLQSEEQKDDLVITDDSPFIYGVKGSIYREMYESIVKPLAHPLGFIYTYQQITSKYITDEFMIDDQFHFSAIEVRQLDGYFFVFTEDENDDNVKATFLTNRINILTNDVFTLAEYKKYVTVFTNKVVDDYEDYTDDGTYRLLKFMDETCIVYYISNSEIKYCTYDDFKNNIYDPIEIRTFIDSTTLYLDYTKDYKIEYTDSIEMAIEGVFVDYMDLADPNDEFAIQEGATFGIFAENGKYGFSTDSMYIYSSDGFYFYMYENE